MRPPAGSSSADGSAGPSEGLRTPALSAGSDDPLLRAASSDEIVLSSPSATEAVDDALPDGAEHPPLRMRRRGSMMRHEREARSRSRANGATIMIEALPLPVAVNTERRVSTAARRANTRHILRSSTQLSDAELAAAGLSASAAGTESHAHGLELAKEPIGQAVSTKKRKQSLAPSVGLSESATGLPQATVSASASQPTGARRSRSGASAVAASIGSSLSSESSPAGTSSVASAEQGAESVAMHPRFSFYSVRASSSLGRSDRLYGDEDIDSAFAFESDYDEDDEGDDDGESHAGGRLAPASPISIRSRLSTVGPRRVAESIESAATPPGRTPLASLFVDDDDGCADGVAAASRLDPALHGATPAETVQRYMQHLEAANGGLVIRPGSGPESGRIRAGTAEVLVERLTYHRNPDPEFVRTMLLTYRSFLTSEELLEMLGRRLKCPVPMALANDDELAAAFETTVARPVRLRVFSVVKYWMVTHFTYDFSGSAAMNAALDVFEERLCEELPGLGARLVSQLARLRSGGNNQRFVASGSAPAPKVPRALGAGAMTVLDVDPTELARQLTLMEMEMYRAIQPYECLNKAWSQSAVEAPHIIALAKRFNYVSRWVSTLVITLGGSAVKRRAAVMKHFLAVAKACRALNNFNGVMEVLSGLHSSPVYRLKKTWAALSKSATSTHAELDALVSTDGNYKNMRELLRFVEPPALPYLGIFLSDLTFIEDGMADRVGADELVNFTKLRHIGVVISGIQMFQQLPYALEPLSALQSWILGHTLVDENDQYALSLKYEPRKS
ncbi:Ras guanine nucleotide exchange factor A [Thecamonas trahens ATCC 50062]|uniref:Ras guanine nucleotide exchange factor A n=1 Tax=Thecamonas trahens ATCC 50062 TaxID=461836 RepID=A0A0L0DJM8_THETB|nr:Ras guanine nucleotide exchange factor A [Thecamonas trahens ATCC 50062]KNC52502.1 Ras guanine nucleotide exchange factor A [Thecamonas trahens ATCC 50062]|eukprot:XP_013755296.1 Ras guanine nucleotide exchange factor A [Thecamonas trahens ATCC 50062]